MIGALYAAVARRRREWYAARPDARRRLRHPVISIGNIAAGGRGKTPFAATVARMLLELGERPAILSRGYARTQPEDGAVIVRDAGAMRADLARAGDEPFMLARQLPGVIVMSCPDRYVAGRLAEHHLGATVHILDDGFQHFQLDRDVDIVLVTREDLDGQTFPSGRLREPPDVLIAADAIVIIDGGDFVGPTFRSGALVDAEVPVFRGRREVGTPVFDSLRTPDLKVGPTVGPTVGPITTESRRVLAVAGIADPRSFFEAVSGAGWTVVATKRFRDHHAYSRRDVDGLFAEARRAGAAGILTTEKDYVRWLPFRPFDLPVGWLPLTMEPDPRAEFRQWLVSSMASARDIVRV